MKITIVIPNWNGKELLKNCLSSLKIQSFKDFEILVVDNGSTDGSVKFIKKTYPRVRIIRFNRNYGFAQAINEGIKKSRSKYIALLNNDAEVHKNYLKNLVEILDKKPDICAVTPLIVKFSNPNIVESAGDIVNVLGQVFHRGYGEPTSKWNIPGRVFLISAGAGLYQRKTFEKIGFFNEGFFAYGEDSDWCLRAQFAGVEFWYEPTAIVYHRHKATSLKILHYLEYLQFRNAYLFILRCFPLKTMLKRGRLFGIVLTNINTFFYLLFRGFILEAIRAELWLIFNLPCILREN